MGRGAAGSAALKSSWAGRGLSQVAAAAPGLLPTCAMGSLLKLLEEAGKFCGPEVLGGGTKGRQQGPGRPELDPRPLGRCPRRRRRETVVGNRHEQSDWRLLAQAGSLGLHWEPGREECESVTVTAFRKLNKRAPWSCHPGSTWHVADAEPHALLLPFHPGDSAGFCSLSRTLRLSRAGTCWRLSATFVPVPATPGLDPSSGKAHG